MWSIILEKWEGLIFLPKDLKHNRHQGGGQINYDDDDYDDDDDDDDDDYDEDNNCNNVFSS